MSTIVGHKVIVVGGGLAGLSAAHTVLERGGRALVLDKKSFLGGNSTKATSGINGALTKTQVKLGIKDSAEAFEADTAKSGYGAENKSTPLVKVLTHESGPAVEWLIDNFGLDLSLISRLGGHSFPRTHRGKERFPGMTITYALMEKFEELSKKMPERACVVTEARVVELVTDKSGQVIGCIYEKNGQRVTEHGPVVIATGGFGADFSKDSLLAQNRPDLLHLPTTNGDHCTGDGIKMSLAAGGSTIDLKMVQVHPTGLVHPNEPDAKIKFLAAEALRGVGGLLLDKNGKRFCNELGTRDYVTGEMWKNAGPFRLVLNGLGSKEIEWHCKHYVGRGLMKRFESGADLAKEIGISADALKKTYDDYNECAKKGSDQYGKKFYHNAPFSMNDTFHVAIVCPVVHYCMGGVQIDHEGRIVKSDNVTPVEGLFAAGEVAGGVHGKNRLGGSGLLGCVVYGRVAGRSAAKHLLDQLSSDSSAATAAKRLGALGRQLNINITVDLEGGAARVDAGASPAPAPAPASAPAASAAPAAPAKKALREISMDEIAKHNTEKDCWVVVNGQVLDCTPFLDKHPGGKQAILLFAGKDASAEFNMLHKPDVVEKYAPEIVIGTLKQ